MNSKRICLSNNTILKLLFLLLFVNYFAITIILKNQFPLSYLRDLMLVILLFAAIKKGKCYFDKLSFLFMCIFAGSCLYGALGSYSINAVIQECRRYIFPLLLFWAMNNLIKNYNIINLLKYILYLISAISLWGVFQAFILKDQFLIKIGYPTRYAFEYGREALNYSYYFGDLGIQRVASTFSSSNICAAILGVTIIFFVINFDYIKSIKHNKICIFIIFVAYIFTFSRANFLAMGIVGILVMWPYVPKKKNLLLIFCGICFFALIYIIAFDNSVLSKIVDWINDSIHLRDSSSAGRGKIWLLAFKELINNPMGIGIGYTGENAYQAGVVKSFACENSYLSMSLDIGIIGMLSYLLFWIINARKLKRKANIYKIKERSLEFKICLSIYAILIYLMIISFFSNHVKDMELICYIFLFVSIGIVFLREDEKIELR